jgi:hypothetical protein
MDEDDEEDLNQDVNGTENRIEMLLSEMRSEGSVEITQP